MRAYNVTIYYEDGSEQTRYLEAVGVLDAMEQLTDKLGAEPYDCDILRIDIEFNREL